MDPDRFEKTFTDLLRSIFNRRPSNEYVKSIYVKSHGTNRTAQIIDLILENEYPHYWKVVQKLKIFL